MKRFFLLLSVAILLFCSCDPKPIGGENEAAEKGVFVLNEGLWQMNNSSISFYNLEEGTIVPDLFLQQNNRGLGDTGSDLKRYGDQLYCVVNVSERLEIIEFKTGKSIAAISLAGRQPRRLAFHDGYAYLSCFNGEVLKIDTVTHTIAATAQAGANPDGICVANGKLYVANSGGLNYPNYGNSITVFDLGTFTPIKEIEVVCNPNRLVAHKNGKIFLISAGNYADISSTLQCIDSQTDEVIKNFNVPAAGFAIDDTKLYFYNYDYNTSTAQFQVVDVASLAIINENFISDGTAISTPYGIAVNPQTHDVYIADAFDYTLIGEVFCFDASGKKKFSFETGINPCAIEFRN